MNKIRFSIITVTYNCVDTVEKAIISIIGQNYTNYEYIIIDGNSTDGTKEILNKYRSKIDILISEHDEGIYDAMNKGISYSQGDVIYFLNSDDYLLSDDILKSVNEEMEKYKPDILSARIKDEFGASRVNNEKDVSAGLIFHAMLPHQGLFVKRGVFEEIGCFDKRYKIAGDYEWMLRAKKKGFCFFYSDLIVAYYSPYGRSKCDTGIIEQTIISKIYIDNYGNKKEKELWDQKRIRAIRLWIIRKTIKKYGSRVSDLIISGIPNDRNIALFGAGRWGHRFFDMFKKNDETNRVSIIFDNSISNSLQESWIGNVSIAPYNKDIDCYVIISAEKGQREITNLLLKNGKIAGDDFSTFDQVCGIILKYGILEKGLDTAFVKNGCITRTELLKKISS